MTELKLLQCRLDGRYDIEDCLGRGSYAEIYVARDRAATDERFRTVVVKALNVMLQGDQDAELERTLIQNFQNEATALDRVRHPNIISRLGHGTAIDLTSTAFHYIVLDCRRCHGAKHSDWTARSSTSSKSALGSRTRMNAA